MYMLQTITRFEGVVIGGHAIHEYSSYESSSRAEDEYSNSNRQSMGTQRVDLQRSQRYHCTASQTKIAILVLMDSAFLSQ